MAVPATAPMVFNNRRRDTPAIVFSSALICFPEGLVAAARMLPCAPDAVILRHLLSIGVLPFTVAVLVPMWLARRHPVD